MIKHQRTIVGLVGEVDLPCGCYAVVAIGQAVIERHGTKHLSCHRCSDWKKHKYELADAERDLAIRLIDFQRKLKKGSSCSALPSRI
jgi:hypothetical protein